MIDMTLGRIAEITGGRLSPEADPDTHVTGFVEFDSRKIGPGGLFVAFPGARVDGHDFVDKAAEAGAAASLTTREVGRPSVIVEKLPPREGDNSDLAANDPDGSAAGVVDGMSKLAAAVARELTDSHGLTIVGVTGSAGKTSTKDLIAAVLSRAGETVAPPGSFNNEIGHPYTVLRCTEDTDFLVAEMSARGIGHIAHLAAIAPPTIGVVLNVGSAHIGEFGSRENIAKAKGELVEALPQSGVAVLNADDELVAGMAPRTNARVVTFSESGNTSADYYATDVELDAVARASFTMHTPNGEPQRVTLGVFGAHQVGNALAAAAVGTELGMDAATVAEALSAASSVSVNRMDVNTRADGVTVINDAYNANPESMRAAIAALGYTAAARPGVRSVAVLGEMNELGAGAEQEHSLLADELARYRVTHLVAVGKSAAMAALTQRAEDQGIRTTAVADTDEAAQAVRELLASAPAGEDNWRERGDRDVVLVKASNAARLWVVAEALLQGHTLR
ncbi:UDP-N-acetylmuramoyl-tripeptide--D-alanyl-D-alanine ligase [Corynebacterium lehmanniae]|uniref:UDP-N-acetylmuramoyl-tripeptide--D-alanyl-D-alanine ligase n=1 Tax=Corynebacterium lehmanniae TaxID=2913497 RepID=A0ABT4RA23_9CORY|nr:UDP-N-acetylmuramoyl-tripeptide--D-alanyl-D-alanine ligase [Corynebacterium lehmanniae]MCZ9292399.1 UDP-N-acetylmuramoyl-tripeptide--D-alanyl-D-alanine ligase [Corynebacterium lehmanniae]